MTLLDILKSGWHNVRQGGICPQCPLVEEEAESPPAGMTLAELQAFVDMDMSLSCYDKLTDEDPWLMKMMMLHTTSAPCVPTKASNALKTIQNTWIVLG